MECKLPTSDPVGFRRRRHIAFRVDWRQGSVSYFVDGALLCKHRVLNASKLHDLPGTWGLGKRVPDDVSS